ncbi:MAG: hypothetical protein ACTSP7_04825 [Candidatus Heimdallarchaeota archaeon]
MSRENVKLPEAELIQGEVDFPGMIKADFRKAMTIMGLATIATAIFTVALWALVYSL